MIYSILGKVITLYSELSPRSLASFTWVIDRKNYKKTTYDKVFEALYTGIVMKATMDTPLHITHSKKGDLSYFENSYLIDDSDSVTESLQDTRETYKRGFGENEQHIKAFSVTRLLSEKFYLEDSKDSFGLQVADILTSSVNRCLKGNFTDNKGMAKMLGKLMVNSHKKDERAIIVNTLSNQSHIQGNAAEIIDLMDSNSFELYKFKKEIRSSRI